MKELPTLTENFIEIAKGEIGKKEIPLGSNWGVHVKKYLASVGINFPASWCMAFVYWCYREAAIKTGQPLTLYKSGGVLNVWNHTAKEHRFKLPQPGDIFIMDHGKGLGHTGIVTDVEGDLIQTIEGNTNDTGSREGIEVCKKQRAASSMKGFIRI